MKIQHHLHNQQCNDHVIQMEINCVYRCVNHDQQHLLLLLPTFPTKSSDSDVRLIVYKSEQTTTIFTLWRFRNSLSIKDMRNTNRVQEWQTDARWSLRIPKKLLEQIFRNMLCQYSTQFYVEFEWVTKKKTLALQSLKLITEERVLGKPPNPSTPLLSSLHPASAVEAFLQPHINFLKTYPRVGNTKPPSHGGYEWI